ncbi:hypothetical protein [Paenibacillus sp. GYB003]|uniref:hypothetical protein n=1 Tax=Paenibacillus sp. GYB003 TaxID=2994392 RepID=UPI002F96B4AE
MPFRFDAAFAKASVLNNPAIAEVLTRVRLNQKDYAREELAVPVCPAEEVSDAILLEQPADSANKVYVPRYKLATERTAGGQEQYRVSVEERAPGWALRVHLLRFPAEEIEQAARDASAMPHRVTVILRYVLVGSGGVHKELTFGDVLEQPDGIQAAVQLDSMAERDELYAALTEPQANAVLIVRRAVQVAVPAAAPKESFPKPPNKNPLPIPTGPVKPLGGPRPYPVRPANPVPPKPQPLSIRTTRAFQDPSKINKLKLSPDLLVVAGRGTANIDLSVAPPKPRYRIVDRVLDIQLPFYFPAHLHGYIFGGIAPASGGPGLIRHQVRHGDDFHSYYQETSRRYLFYYLPDAFKLARLPEPPYLPFLSAKFTSEDGSLRTSRATLDYAAVPCVAPDRLEAAAQELKAHVSGTLPDGIAGPVFQPLLADTGRLSFRLALPNRAGPFQLREGALINLKEGIVDSLSLSLQELQQVFEALMGSETASFLMTGEVEVHLDDEHHRVAEKVPFTARMDDLAGELFDYAYSPDPASGGVQVTLRNLIESPVRIGRLNARLDREGTEVPCELQGVAFPVERLASGEELVFTVVPAPGHSGEGKVSATVLPGPGDVAVIPDREAIWNAIQDPFTAQYEQDITVKTLPAIFNLPPGKPEEQRLSEIVVELKHGEDSGVTVSLSPEQPEVKASLPFPIADVLLRRANSGVYEYRVSAIRLSGQTTKEWKAKSGDLLYILQGDVD